LVLPVSVFKKKTYFLICSPSPTSIKTEQYGKKKTKPSKEKKMTLRDYEQKLMLERGGLRGVSESNGGSDDDDEESVLL
jgi:hypothetical protein